MKERRMDRSEGWRSYERMLSLLIRLIIDREIDYEDLDNLPISKPIGWNRLF
jgi:hypothetical protein